MSKALLRPLAPPMIGLCAILTACASQTPTPGTSPPARETACTAFGPILFSRLHDTPETIEAVKAHNAAWEALCRKGAR